MTEPVSHTKAQRFLFATKGQVLIGHLLREPKQSFRHVFPDSVIALIDQCKGKTSNLSAEDLQLLIVAPVMMAVFDKAYPVSHHSQRRTKIMQWVIDRILGDRHNNEQIWAEDFYKIADDIGYFEKLKNVGRIKNQHITDVKNLKELRKILQPFRENYAQKEQARLERHMTDDEKNSVMQETTILYEGDDGRVVIVHTIEASRYWGNGTRWCLAREDKDGEVNFNDYNAVYPIIMILPRHDEKYALVERVYYDSQDEILTCLPDKPMQLLEKAKCRSDAMRLRIDQLEENRSYQDAPSTAIPISSVPCHLTPEQKKWADIILGTMGRGVEALSLPDEVSSDKELFLYLVQARGMAIRYAHKDIQKNQVIALAAVQSCGYAFKFLDDSLKKDRAISLAAVKNCGIILQYLDDSFKKDPEIVLTAVIEDGYALQYADIGFRKDKTIVLAAVTESWTVIKFADDSLKKDLDFIALCMEYSPVIGA